MKKYQELLKRMAMADGVLSENEKTVFREVLSLTDEEANELFNEIECELESIQSETEIINWKYKNGLDFEKYVVRHFPSNFHIQNWTGDKYIDGKYDTHNLDPDIIVKVTTPTKHTIIAIECKFHMGYHNNLAFIAKKEQLERYRQYQNNNNIPVFIALGIGGSGANPEEFFVVPLNAIKFSIATQEYLSLFKKETNRKLFYYLHQKGFR